MKIFLLALLLLLLLTGCEESTVEKQRDMQACFDAGYDKLDSVTCGTGEVRCLNASSDSVECVRRE
jgi:PBP1b-binding outer membrane lipoprotein LpoB